MLKKIGFFSLLFTICLTLGFSQQLTRFGFIDMAKVYQEYNQQSQAVRQYQAELSRVNQEVDRRQNELRTLDSRRADAIQRGDQNTITSLTADIVRRTEDLRMYFQAKTAELEALRRNLTTDAFMQEILNELRLFAESEGITAFFDLNNTQGILWYSPSIDYTNTFIIRLRSRFN